MASITIRNVSDAVRRALRGRAAQHERCTEAETRRFPEQATKPEGRRMLGSLLTSIAREAGELTGSGAAQLDQRRDRMPAKPIRFE